jgi:hypothetical protein
MTAKKVDPDRVYRVAIKILKGLFYYNEGELIPEDKPITFDIISPDQKLPEIFMAALGVKPILGDFKACFAYRYGQFPEAHNMWLWTFWLWESLTLTFAFHDLNCECEECKPSCPPIS